KTTVRHLLDCAVKDETSDTANVVGCDLNPNQRHSVVQMISIEVEADGFLYNMVRNIVGSLVEIGRGRREPSWLADVLASKDRDRAGPTAPAHGLFLQRVDYDPFDKPSSFLHRD
ncbi:MAG: hypothetical protein AAGA03_16605, partial [Planctomycetota bacterium]